MSHVWLPTVRQNCITNVIVYQCKLEHITTNLLPVITCVHFKASAWDMFLPFPAYSMATESTVKHLITSQWGKFSLSKVHQVEKLDPFIFLIDISKIFVKIVIHRGRWSKEWKFEVFTPPYSFVQWYHFKFDAGQHYRSMFQKSPRELAKQS